MTTPAPPPTEFPPEYIAENNGGRVVAATTVMFVMSTVLYALRIYARSLAQGKRGWDDIVMIPAYFFLVGVFAVLYCEVTLGGLGRHAAVVMMEDPMQIRNNLLLLYILEWFYVLTNMTSRMSVVILYLRIFATRWARVACWFVLAFLAANCLSQIIAAQLECRPLAFAWDKTIQGGSCFNLLLWYQLANIPNVVADLMIMALPVPTVWGLKASTARKTGIAAVCLTGSIGLIASCVRTGVFFKQADVINTDPTFADEAFSWTAVESGMYFSAACLIGMRPLLGHFSKWYKNRFGGVTNDMMKSPNGQNTDELPLKGYRKKNPYASLETDDDSALRSRIETSVPVPAGAHIAHDAHHQQWSNSNDIRVDTEFEVRRGDKNEFDSRYP